MSKSFATYEIFRHQIRNCNWSFYHWDSWKKMLSNQKAPVHNLKQLFDNIFFPFLIFSILALSILRWPHLQDHIYKSEVPNLIRLSRIERSSKSYNLWNGNVHVHNVERQMIRYGITENPAHPEPFAVLMSGSPWRALWTRGSNFCELVEEYLGSTYSILKT